MALFINFDGSSPPRVILTREQKYTKASLVYLIGSAIVGLVIGIIILVCCWRIFTYEFHSALIKAHGGFQTNHIKNWAYGYAIGSIVIGIVAAILATCTYYFKGRVFGCYSFAPLLMLSLSAPHMIGAIVACKYYVPIDHSSFRMTLNDSKHERKWDNLQSDLQCCGVESYKDWYHNTRWPLNENVPDSCCYLTKKKTFFYKTCGVLESPSAWYDVGCADKLIKLYDTHKKIIIFIVLTVGIFEIFIVFFSVLFYIIRPDANACLKLF